MIRVVAKVLIKADKADAFAAAGKDLVAASKKDAGNIGYTLNVSANNPLQFAFIENWQDQAALDAHMKQPHFLAFGGVIKECAAGEMSIELFREV